VAGQGDLHASDALLFLDHLWPLPSVASHLQCCFVWQDKETFAATVLDVNHLLPFLSLASHFHSYFVWQDKETFIAGCEPGWPFASVASHLCCSVWQDKETFTATVLEEPFVAFLVSCISLPFLFCVAGQGDLHSHSAGCEPGCPFSSVASHFHSYFVWQDKETFTATVLHGPFVAFLVSCISLPFLFCVAGQGDLHSHSARCEPGRPYLQMPEPTGLHPHLTAQQGEGHLAQP